ncbi:DMT family transporter [Planctomicrobium sp. SH664]|uniref:DMT family transporter n=1 Tax=Planctomicrobium sp. SH664 TaxID=3448125 RepID=UPI003F5BBDE0
MQTVLLLLLATLAGVVVPFQSIVNGRLGQLVNNPFLAAFISFLGGTVALAVLAALWQGGVPRLPDGVYVPWHLCTGGLAGVVFITVVLLLVPKIGTAEVLSATIAGQLMMSLVVDHLGLVGMPRVPISGTRLLGVVVLLVGTWLVKRG